MSERFMVLPAREFEKIRLLQVPDDYGQRDALRRVTALIAELEEENPQCTWDEVSAVLEDHGFVSVPFQLGPELD